MTNVSVIIPCRNEEKFIARCLGSVVNQDFPKENFEVLVVDGSSFDRTKEIVKSYASKYSFVKLLDNPQKYTPFGLNIGIRAAKGNIIVRMDAHAGYDKDYISKCVKFLQDPAYNADNVGGVIKTLPAEDTPAAKAIALCLSSRLGAASSFRVGSQKPIFTDTVFGGCYKREIFDKIGYFDERMTRSQDIELNKRLAAAGGKILLVPEISANYFPQATMGGFSHHNFDDGFWVTYPMKFGIKFFSLRHLLPIFFVSSLFLFFLIGTFVFWLRFAFDIELVFYFLTVFFFSLAVSLKKGISLLPHLMAAYFIRHFFYGLGSLWGLVKIKI